MSRATETGADVRGRFRTLCFQCYRTQLDRERELAAAFKSAAELETSSTERFQSLLPFEPVNRARLERLKAERALSRTVMSEGVGRFADRRRQAQLAARHALQRIAAGLGAGSSARRDVSLGNVEAEHAWSSAVHAAELQLPEAWLPFVVSR